MYFLVDMLNVWFAYLFADYNYIALLCCITVCMSAKPSKDFKGRGEYCPTPHFYQNLGEAEYVVATYQYMRLLGYPAQLITILSTYNGQKQLIRDILSQRCSNSVFGMPAVVSTVDKYQGQQNDYILLSLVRTESVGHLRDVRRLVVAMSRARLGLYVFGNHKLFGSCLELQSAMRLLVSPHSIAAAGAVGAVSSTGARLSKGSTQGVSSERLLPCLELQIVIGEGYPCVARCVGYEDCEVERYWKSKVHTVTDVTAMGILVYQMVQQAQQLQTQLRTSVSSIPPSGAAYDVSTGASTVGTATTTSVISREEEEASNDGIYDENAISNNDSINDNNVLNDTIGSGVANGTVNDVTDNLMDTNADGDAEV